MGFCFILFDKGALGVYDWRCAIACGVDSVVTPKKGLRQIREYMNDGSSKYPATGSLRMREIH